MPEKLIKMQVNLVPVKDTPGGHLARNQKVNVEFEDLHSKYRNGRHAFFLACQCADCNPVNYTASTTEL